MFGGHENEFAEHIVFQADGAEKCQHHRAKY